MEPVVNLYFFLHCLSHWLVWFLTIKELKRTLKFWSWNTYWITSATFYWSKEAYIQYRDRGRIWIPIDRKNFKVSWQYYGNIFTLTDIRRPQLQLCEFSEEHLITHICKFLLSVLFLELDTIPVKEHIRKSNFQYLKHTTYLIWEFGTNSDHFKCEVYIYPDFWNRWHHDTGKASISDFVVKS